jgi:Phosphate-selective porin O and P
MKPTALLASVLTTALCFPTAGTADSQTPTNAELWEIIQAQQKEIESLKQQQQTTEQKANSAGEKAEAAVEAVENGTPGTADSGNWAYRTRIGGYGELHYNNIDASDPAYDNKEIDLHRFVLYAGHEFSDDIRFFSEFEIEHVIASSDDADSGEVEVEQAYLEFDLQDNLRARGGLFLLPVGILNETHEPNTFYGVERNDVENIIIPATWWAGGAGVSGQYGNGISWDLAIHEGLMIPTSGSDAFRVRSGRQETSEASAENLAYSGRLRYTGVPGLELAASVNYQSDASQVGGDGLDSGLLFETHVVYGKGPFGLRALYAEWDFDGLAVTSADADKQTGWYIEPGFKVRDDVGLYTRYEDVKGALGEDRFDQWEVGVNYWPHEDVVLKADYRSRDHDLASESGRDFDAFDLGIGYQF